MNPIQNQPKKPDYTYERLPRCWDRQTSDLPKVYEKLRNIIGSRYLNASWDQCSLKDDIWKFLQTDYEATNKRRGLYLHGVKGTGKSCIMALIAKYLLQRFYVDIDYYSAPQLFNLLYSASPVEVMNIKTAGVLMIDDLNREMSNQLTISRFNEIIEHRYSWNLPTFITSNLTPKDLEKIAGYDAAAHRFQDNSFMITGTLTEQKRV